jgi:predicted metal-dependent peptidase
MRVILQRFLQEYSKGDYSWQKPNRRYWPEWHLPSLHSRSLIDITVAVDTSGSVDDDQFQIMVSEIAGIFRIVKPKEITLIQFDTNIKSITKIRSLRDLRQCEFTGRGGTKVNAVIDWAILNKPQLLMFFTDGEFNAPPQEYTANKTLWLIHNNDQFRSNYGKVVHYEMP